MGSPLMPGLQGAVLYNIQVSHFSAKYSAKSSAANTAVLGLLHVFTAYGQIPEPTRTGSECLLWVMCVYIPACKHEHALYVVVHVYCQHPAPYMKY